jgi:NADH-quinone oxidoreductase subunit E
MAIDPSKVRRFAHGSRVPGWDEAADLTKAPAVVPDPATTPVPDHVRAAIEAAMARYPDVRSASIPALHVVQREHGWCSPTAIEQAACVLRLTPAYLSAVATFYDMFETEPKGRHDIYVCTNISCSLMGADHLYEAMLSAAGDDAEFNVRSFECLGACDIAPMASVDGEYVGPLTEADCRTIVDDVRAGREPLPDKQLKYRKVATTYWQEQPARAIGAVAASEMARDGGGDGDGGPAGRTGGSAGDQTASGPTASGNDVGGEKDM